MCICERVSRIVPPFIPLSLWVCRIIHLDRSCLFCERGNWFCGFVCELSHIYAFCTPVYKSIWVCVSFLSACPCTESQIPCAAWTQRAGVSTPARLRGASLMDTVCVPGSAFPPQACSIKIDPSFPPIPFSLTPLCASAFMRPWIGEARRLQQMAELPSFTVSLLSLSHYTMNERPGRKEERKCDN